MTAIRKLLPEPKTPWTSETQAYSVDSASSAAGIEAAMATRTAFWSSFKLQVQKMKAMVVGVKMCERGSWERGTSFRLRCKGRAVARLLVFGCVGLRHLFDLPPVEQQTGHVV